jgi:hypothetical protein
MRFLPAIQTLKADMFEADGRFWGGGDFGVWVHGGLNAGRFRLVP